MNSCIGRTLRLRATRRRRGSRELGGPLCAQALIERGQLRVHAIEREVPGESPASGLPHRSQGFRADAADCVDERAAAVGFDEQARDTVFDYFGEAADAGCDYG